MYFMDFKMYVRVILYVRTNSSILWFFKYFMIEGILDEMIDKCRDIVFKVDSLFWESDVWLMDNMNFINKVSLSVEDVIMLYNWFGLKCFVGTIYGIWILIFESLLEVFGSLGEFEGFDDFMSQEISGIYIYILSKIIYLMIKTRICTYNKTEIWGEISMVICTNFVHLHEILMISDIVYRKTQ